MGAFPIPFICIAGCKCTLSRCCNRAPVTTQNAPHPSTRGRWYGHNLRIKSISCLLVGMGGVPPLGTILLRALTRFAGLLPLEHCEADALRSLGGGGCLNARRGPAAERSIRGPVLRRRDLRPEEAARGPQRRNISAYVQICSPEAGDLNIAFSDEAKRDVVFATDVSRNSDGMRGRGAAVG